MAYAEFETILHDILVSVTGGYVQRVTRQLESKNRELNRLNQRLKAHERSLQMEVEQASQALETANEFNHRVIENLSAGLMVVDSQTLDVTLYSQRMEEILGIPVERVWRIANRRLRPSYTPCPMPFGRC